jgi:MFS family permease
VTGRTGGGRRLSPIRLLQLTAFVSALDRFAMPPMLIAIALSLDVPLSQIVHAAAAYFLAYGLMQPVWGMVSDRFGLVPTMRFTLLAAAVSTITAAFMWTPVALGVARGFAGAFFGAAFPSSLIYLGDTVPADRRHQQITDLMVGIALGTALASAGAGALALVSWRATFVLTGVAALALAVALGHLPRPTTARTHSTLLAPVREVARSGPARLVLLLAFLEGAVLLGVLTLLPPAVEATGASAAVAGGVTAAYGVAVLGFARLVGHLSLRLHPWRIIALGASSATLACAMIAWSRSPVVAVVVATLLGLGWAAMHSSLQTWATEVLPGARATVVSLFASGLFIGSAVAAMAVAGYAEADRYRTIFVAATITAVPLGLLASWGRARWTRPGESRA